MINKDSLLNTFLNSTDSKGIFKHILNKPLNINGYILKNRIGVNYLELWYPNNNCVMDNPDYILIYSQELLDINYSSILIGGLGLGTQAYVSQDFAQVDVIEIDQNIIDINNQLGYLNENVNIINDDILTYTPTKTYDIIVLDIWWCEGLTEELTDTLTTKYLPFVNEGGFLYFPINLGVLSSKVKILK